MWKMLWLKTESDELPKGYIPPLFWAYIALGKLGGSKKTSYNTRIGWQILWKGWEKLESLVEGWELLNSNRSSRQIL